MYPAKQYKVDPLVASYLHTFPQEHVQSIFMGMLRIGAIKEIGGVLTWQRPFPINDKQRAGFAEAIKAGVFTEDMLPIDNNGNVVEWDKQNG